MFTTATALLHYLIDKKDASKDVLPGRLIPQPILDVIESEVEAAAVGDNTPRLYIAEYIAAEVVCADGSA